MTINIIYYENVLFKKKYDQIFFPLIKHDKYDFFMYLSSNNFFSSRPKFNIFPKYFGIFEFCFTTKICKYLTHANFDGYRIRNHGLKDTKNNVVLKMAPGKKLVKIGD